MRERSGMMDMFDTWIGTVDWGVHTVPTPHLYSEEWCISV